MTLKAQDRIQKMKQVLNEKELTRVAYDYFKSITPIDSGNARRNTRQFGNEVQANYAYAKRLNNGWSRQAPDGMVNPTVDHLRKYIKQKLGT